jgi:hypothetical protein
MLDCFAFGSLFFFKLDLLVYFWYLFGLCFCGFLGLFFIRTAGFVFISSQLIRVFDESLWSFVIIQSHFDLLLVHDGATGSVPVSHVIAAFVCVVSELKATLASDCARFFLLWFHLFLLIVNFQILYFNLSIHLF